MSIYGCGVKQWDKKIKDPGYDNKARKRIYDKFVDLALKWQNGAEYKNAKDLGFNTTEEFHAIYRKYTHKELDPDFMPITFKDLRKFELGLRYENERFAKPSGVFARNFFLPKAVLQSNTILRSFEKNLTEESSYFRRYSVESGKQVNDILNEFNLFTSSMGAAKLFPSLIKGKGVRKGSNTELRKLYTDIEKLQSRLPYANSTEQNKISTKLRQLTSQVNKFYENGAGEAFLIFNNVLQGADIQSIPNLNGVQRKQLQKMKSNYMEIRKSSVKGLIRGLQKIKQMAVKKDLMWVDSTIDKINGLIKQMEFQERVDNSGNLLDYKDLQSERDFAKLGFEPSERYTAGDGKLAFSKHYMSQYTLGLLKTVKKIDSAVHDGKLSLDAELKQEIDSWEGITNRAKGRSYLRNAVYDNDPFFFLKKYTNDVGIFNYRVHLKSNFAEAITTLQKEHLDVAKAENRPDLEESALSMMEVIKNVNEEVQLADPTAKGWLDDIARVATSYTYFRLMGGNIRSAARNATQRIYEVIELGVSNWNAARKWYKDSGLSNPRLTKLNRQLQKFGLQWFDGTSVSSTLLGSLIGDNQSTKLSESSRGALEQAHSQDADLYVNKDGELTINSGERVTAKVANLFSNIAGRAGFMHKVAEDWNRSRTFRTAFALIHNNLESADRNWIAKQILDVEAIKKLKGQDYQVSNKDLVDKFGDKLESKISDWVENKAGRMSYNMVMDLHFEYAKWNKAKIVRASERDNMLVRGLKTGIGQFSHYRFNMVNLMYKWMKEGGISMRAGDFTSSEVGRMVRLGLMQSMITGMSIATQVNFQKLMPNDVTETAKALYYWLEVNREKLVEGRVDPETAKAFNEQTYGQGGWYFLGPNVPYLLGAAEIIHKTYDPGADPLFEKVENQVLKNTESKEFYDKIAIVNSQAARTLAYTLPIARDGAGWIDAARLELGLFPDKTQRDAHRKIRETLGYKKKKKKRRSLNVDEINAVLDMF